MNGKSGLKICAADKNFAILWTKMTW
jgi:hypothetical protein